MALLAVAAAAGLLWAATSASASQQDAVSVQITGGVNYSNAGTLTTGDLRVAPLLGSVRSVLGSGFIPGINGGEARVAFNAKQLGRTPIFNGYLTVKDASAGVNVRAYILFTRVTRTPPHGASGQGWGVTSTLRVFRVRWTVQEGDVPGETDPVFVGAGDIALCNNENDEATARLLDDIPGTVFTLGDNVQLTGSAAEFALCYDPTWGRHKARTRPTIGNHEYLEGSNAAPYFSYFGPVAGTPGQGWRSYDLGEWHIVHLNSNCDRVDCGPGSPQAQWLAADLAANEAHCTVALMHHPPFTSTAVAGSGGDEANLLQVLYDHGVDVLMTGHAHVYERFAPQTPQGIADTEFGIRQFTVGTGGAPHHPFGPPVANSEVRDIAKGVLKLVLRADGYEWEFVSTPSFTFTDSGAGACHDAPS